jgi:hypothetical protein
LNDNLLTDKVDRNSNPRLLLVLLSKAILLFTLAAITVHYTGRLLWPYEASYYFDRHDSWVERLQALPEIVFLGSSTVLFGVSPSIVQQQLDLPNASVIDLGFEARSPIVSDYVWSHEKQTLSKSKIVIYGLDPWIFSDVYYGSDYFATLHFSLFQAFYQAVHPSDLKHLNLAAFGGPSFLTVLHGLLTYQARLDQPIPQIPDDYGGRILQGRPSNYSRAARIREYFGSYPIYGISDLYVERFAELKKQVEASGATFLLLLPPKRAKWSESYRGDCADIDSDLVSKLNSHLGPAKVFGSFDLVPPALESQYFQDDFHLGEAGQRFFSHWIALHLKEALAKPPEKIRPLASY